MINRLIGYSLNNRLIIIFISFAILAGGAYILNDIEIDVFPSLTAPTVAVLTDAHGMATEEVEKLITFPIESSFSGAANVRRVRSSSAGGISITWVEFDWGSDIYRARQIVSEKLSAISERLPASIPAPILAPQVSLLGEIMLIGISSDSLSQLELRSLTDRLIKLRLLAVPGVSDVVVIGGESKQYQVNANPIKMAAYNVTLDDLKDVCKGLGKNTSGSFYNEYGQEYSIRGISKTGSIQVLGESAVKTREGATVRLKDVAEVRAGHAQKTGSAFIDRKPAVILTILKQPDSNTLEITESIDKAIEEMKMSLPTGVAINSSLMRQADFIDTAIANVLKVLIEGAIFVMIILFLFLLNFRTTFISLITIPISLIISALVLKFLGMAINTMSLGGMAIAIGVLVDDAIIDVENVIKRLKENRAAPQEERRPSKEVIYDASIEIRPSIVQATFIIILAFMPLFFLSGLEGRMLAPLGLAFIISLFASMIVALTLTPVLSSYLLTNSKFLGKAVKKQNPVLKHIQFFYEKLLAIALKRRRIILALSFTLFAIALFVLINTSRSFLPEFNEGVLTITAITMPGVSLDESSKLADRIDKALMSIEEIHDVSRRTGRAELNEHSHGGANSSEIDAPFKLDGRPRAEFMEEVREKLAGISGMSINIGQPLGHRISHMLSGSKSDIAIKVFGSSMDRMYNIASNVKESIESTEGLVDVNIEQLVEVPQLQVKPKSEMLAKFGIPMNYFSEFIDIAFAGEELSEIYEENLNVPLVLRYRPESRNSKKNIENALIDASGGRKIPLSYVAEIVSSSGPNEIKRENMQRKITVTANVEGRGLTSILSEIKAKIAENTDLPEGYRIEYGGQFESEQRASLLLLITSAIAALIILLILYSEFRAFDLALVILLNLPLALIGGMFAVWLGPGMLNIPAIIGFITLFGIATRNGILLISRYESLAGSGAGLKQAIIEGSASRLNPILMTALASMLALIPLAARGGETGNEIQSPMAVVILGGLVSSTLLNLFITPIVYFLINRRKSNA